MQHSNLDDLIDLYLKRKLNDPETEELKKMISSNPQIAETVEDSEEAFRFLQYLRYQQIKKQLQESDAIEVQIRRRLAIKRWTISAMLLLVGLMSSWIYMTAYYNSENLAGKYFEPMIFDGHIPDGYSAEDTLHLHAADHSMKNGDYQNASRLWYIYSENGNLRFHAKWNVLMCHFAMNGPDAWWKREMTTFLAIPDNPFRQQGKKMFQLVNSSMYKFITGNSSNAMSALKPRLI